MNQPPLPIRVFTAFLATTFGIFATAHAQSSLWTGAGTPSNSWNVDANWSPTGVPNAIGANVTFSPNASLTVNADTDAATNITFGNLTTTTNQNLILGSSTDNGTFTINGGTGGAVWAVSSSLNSGRGITLQGEKVSHFTLGSNLTVNLNAGNSTGRLLRVRQNSSLTGAAEAALNGGGNTITLNGGRLFFGASGADGNVASNVTLDVRNAETNAVAIEGNSRIMTDDVTILIGNSGGQNFTVAGSVSLQSNFTLHGDVTFLASGSRTITFAGGVISDGAGSNRVTFQTSGGAGLNVNINGGGPNTYSGGTVIDLAGTGNRNVTATKSGAFGTGDVALTAGRITLGGSQTVAGLNGNTGTEIVSNTANISLTRTLTLNQTSGSFTYAGSIGLSDNSTLRNIAVVKNGAGTQIFTGNNTYSGGTIINAGTLLVNNTVGSGTGSGSVTVNSGGTLGGNGTIAGAVTVSGGTLAPGNSPGTLTINNSLSLSSSAVLAWEINISDTTVGGGINDLVTGVTNLTLDGTINFTLIGGPQINSAGTWRLFNYSGSLTDNILDIGSLSLASGFTASIDTSVANQVNLVVVPEPATWGLLAAAGTICLIFRRRRLA